MSLDKEDDELEETSTGLLGDDPIESKKIMDKEAEEKIKKEQKEQAKAFEEAMITNMNKMGDALTKTYKEIMTGEKPKEKKEGVK